MEKAGKHARRKLLPAIEAHQAPEADWQQSRENRDDVSQCRSDESEPYQRKVKCELGQHQHRRDEMCVYGAAGK